MSCQSCTFHENSIRYFPVSGADHPVKPKVLIVDDERSIRNWIRSEIEEKHPDYEVKEAKDGFSAGELVGAWKPDAVILDPTTKVVPTINTLYDHAQAVGTGIPSVMQTARTSPASAASRIASAAPGGGTKIIATFASVYWTASTTELKTGMPSM